MINENINRVQQFDSESNIKKHTKIIDRIDEEELEEIDKFDNPDASLSSNVIKAPSCFLGNLKDY